MCVYIVRGLYITRGGGRTRSGGPEKIPAKKYLPIYIVVIISRPRLSLSRSPPVRHPITIARRTCRGGSGRRRRVLPVFFFLSRQKSSRASLSIIRSSARTCARARKRTSDRTSAGSRPPRRRRSRVISCTAFVRPSNNNNFSRALDDRFCFFASRGVGRVKTMCYAYTRTRSGTEKSERRRDRVRVLCTRPNGYGGFIFKPRSAVAFVVPADSSSRVYL